MKSAAPRRRDRLRQILADLRMPGAPEALDVILQGSMGRPVGSGGDRAAPLRTNPAAKHN